MISYHILKEAFEMFKEIVQAITKLHRTTVIRNCVKLKVVKNS